MLEQCLSLLVKTMVLKGPIDPQMDDRQITHSGHCIFPSKDHLRSPVNFGAGEA